MPRGVKLSEAERADASIRPAQTDNPITAECLRTWS